MSVTHSERLNMAKQILFQLNQECASVSESNFECSKENNNCK